MEQGVMWSTCPHLDLSDWTGRKNDHKWCPCLSLTHSFSPPCFESHAHTHTHTLAKIHTERGWAYPGTRKFTFLLHDFSFGVPRSPSVICDVFCSLTCFLKDPVHWLSAFTVTLCVFGRERWREVQKAPWARSATPFHFFFFA